MLSSPPTFASPPRAHPPRLLPLLAPAPLLRVLPLLLLLAPPRASAQTCDASSFPIATPGVQCYGLSAEPDATTVEQCALACCALGTAACSTWQFCPAGAGCSSPSACWLGQPVGDPNANVCRASAGWTGGIRGTPPTVGAYYAIVPVNASSGLPLNSAARHCQSGVSADPYEGIGDQDFNWRAIEAVNDDPNSVSFQPYNWFFNYLSSPKSGSIPALIAARFTEAPSPGDLSWRVVPGLQNPNLFSLLSQSPSYPAGAYATLSSAVTAPCAYNSPAGDLVLAPANSPTAGNGSTVTQTFMFVPLQLRSSSLWTQERHDAQSSGFTDWDGPGESVAVCHEQMIKDDPLNLADTARFFSSGVTSAVDGWWRVPEQPPGPPHWRLPLPAPFSPRPHTGSAETARTRSTCSRTFS